MLWSFPVAAYQHGSPVFAPETDRIYFGSNEGVFYCLDANGGELVWTFLAGSPIRGVPELSNERNLVVFGTDGGDVFALDSAGGELRFHFRTHGEVRSKPLVLGDRCFISCADKTCSVFELAAGVRLKNIHLGTRSFTSPALIGNSVFVGTASGAVAEIDAASLKVVGGIQLLECITGPICFHSRSATFYALCNSGEIFAFRRTLRAAAPPEPPEPPKQRRSSKRPLPTTAASAKPERMFSLIGRIPQIEVLAAEVTANARLFSVDRSRQTKIKVQRETEFIPLRRAARAGGIAVNDNELVEETKLAGAFPVLMKLLNQIAAAKRASLERAMIVKMPPGAKVYPHIDKGRYYASRDRYHLVVQTGEGASILKCGSEVVQMGLGEVWWLNNKAMHSSGNNGSTERIHVIFDLAPRH